jgi:hypothetical protein
LDATAGKQTSFRRQGRFAKSRKIKGLLRFHHSHPERLPIFCRPLLPMPFILQLEKLRGPAPDKSYAQVVINFQNEKRIPAPPQ